MQPVTGFTQFHAYEAVLLINGEKYASTVEMRRSQDTSDCVHVEILGKAFLASSIGALLFVIPFCSAISLVHHIQMISAEQPEWVELLETIIKMDNKTFPLATSLSISIGSEQVTTEPCTHFTEALDELFSLLERNASCDLICCHTCEFSALAMFELTDERFDLSCFRDRLNDLQKIRLLGKSASREDRWSGAYFVDSLHRCSAWRPTSRRTLE